MLKAISPQDQVFWYLGRTICEPLREDLKVDVVVVGGGMAGLSAAQSFHAKGLSVALLEKNYCGAGASGKSSGFITPDSEYSLSDLIKLYGADQAKEIWEFVSNGVTFIENNINNFSLDCDYQVQGTLIAANSDRDLNVIEKEFNARVLLDYQSTIYNKAELDLVMPSGEYAGAISYGNTFGINAYKYCQEIKLKLKDLGVKIYEDIPVTEIGTNYVKTAFNKVQADYIIVCIDRFIPELQKLTYKIYHAQTFLMLSAPLEQTQVQNIFTQSKFMVWDTDLIYNYFRLTGDNRLMLGGASLLSTYASKEQHNNQSMFSKLDKYFKRKFAKVNVEFEYMWPGLIGITKDIIPIAGTDKDVPNVYYISGCAGLPWAAALGAYSAEYFVEKNTYFDSYFSPQRRFIIGPLIQNIIGTKLTFALSNFMSLGSL